MVEGNYNKVLERIAKTSGLSIEDIQRKIEAKIAKLAGLISKEGAAQIVCAELGISLENEKFKIDELLPGMRKVNVVGKVINLFPVRTFERQGKTNKVANFIMADETSNIKVVLWDTNHIELIESGKITEGSSVEISGGGIRDNEIHLGSFSDFKPSDQKFEEVKTERIVKEKSIAEFKPRDSVSVRAFIVQAFDPRFFHVCPECKKKVVLEGDKYVCEAHGNVPAEKRALINIVIDDGTESIRTVLFNDVLPDLGLTELDDTERLFNQKQDLLGKEMLFSGVIRMNSFFNNPEFIVDKVNDIDLDNLINKLENKG